MSVKFVLCEQRGSGEWRPVRAFDDKMDAVAALLAGYPLTWDEERRVTRFVVSGDLSQLPLIIAGPLLPKEPLGVAPNRRLSHVQ